MISSVEAWTRRHTGLEVLDAPNLDAWQMARLREAVAYACCHSRFYTGHLAGIDPSLLLTRPDLAALPFTMPEDLASDPMAFLCVPPRDVARLTTLNTSGTTGPPKRVAFTAGDLERTVDFFAEGMKTLVSPGQRVLILMPSASEHSIGRLLQAAVARIGVTGILGNPGGTADEALAAAQDVHCLVGLPAQVFYLSRLAPDLRPETVLLSADYAAQSAIRAIEQAWQCRVLTHFGMTETGFGCAVQCLAQAGHHLRDAELLLEIVDPDTGALVPDGALGEIVVTTLMREAMPLLRYRTGDLSRRIIEPCACGSLLPRLGRVEGRCRRVLPAALQAFPSMHTLEERLFGLPGLRAFVADLREEDTGPVLHLRVAPEAPLDSMKLAHWLGREVRLHHAAVSPFPAQAKRHIVIHAGATT